MKYIHLNKAGVKALSIARQNPFPYFLAEIALKSYGNTFSSTGEILPYGVRAVWEGEDVSLKGNIGIGRYAFVIDSGVLNTTNDLTLNTEWSKAG